MVENGWLEFGRAPEKPQFKKSGYVVNPIKAYKTSLPCFISQFDPLPVILRQDYIYHILMYHKQRAYKSFPENKYPLLDDFNLRLVYNLEKLKELLPSIYENNKEILGEMGVEVDEDYNRIMETKYKLANELVQNDENVKKEINLMEEKTKYDLEIMGLLFQQNKLFI
jgi:hypothetical protein